MSKFRNFCGVLYEEDIPLLRDYLKVFISNQSIRFYALIQHLPEDNEKEKHYHLIIKYYNPRTVSSISKKIGLRDGKIQVCYDFDVYCRYLLHLDEISKTRYFLDDVETNDIRYYEAVVRSKSPIESHDVNIFLTKAFELAHETYGFAKYIDKVRFLPYDVKYFRQYYNIIKDYYYNVSHNFIEKNT